MGDRAAVIAVGSGDKRDAAERFGFPAQVIERRPSRFETGDAPAELSVDRPARAENLERREAVAGCLDLGGDLLDIEELRDPGKVNHR